MIHFSDVYAKFHEFWSTINPLKVHSKCEIRIIPTVSIGPSLCHCWGPNNYYPLVMYLLITGAIFALLCRYVAKTCLFPLYILIRVLLSIFYLGNMFSNFESSFVVNWFAHISPLNHALKHQMCPDCTATTLNSRTLTMTT